MKTMGLERLELLTESWSRVVSLQTQILERDNTLNWIERDFALPKKLPVFLWNLGQREFRRVMSGDVLNIKLLPKDSVLNSTIDDCLQVLDSIIQYPDNAVFIIENLQSLMVLPSGSDSASRKYVQQIFLNLTNLAYSFKSSKFQKYLILLGTEDIDLPIKLNDLIPQINNPLPDQEEIRSFLNTFFASLDGYDTSALDINSLAVTASGLSLEEMKIALRLGINQENTTFKESLLDFKIKRLKAYGMQFISKPVVPQIGGLDRLKEGIEAVKVDYLKEAREYKIPLPKGILLVGPPGTGKTLSASIIADKLGFPLIVVDAGAVNAGGAPFLRRLIERVEASEPAVIYFDEFDKLFTISSEGQDNNSGNSRAVLGTLLTWLQEKRSKIYVIATLNRLKALPPELTRKGRFDELYYVDFPNAGERRDVFLLHCARFDDRYKGGKDPLSFTEWRQILNATDKCTSSELSAIVESAAAKISRQYIREAQESGISDRRPVRLGVNELLAERKLITPLYLRDTDRIISLENESRYVCKPASSKDASDYCPDLTSFWGEKLESNSQSAV